MRAVFGTSSSADNNVTESYGKEMNCRFAAGDKFGGEKGGK